MDLLFQRYASPYSLLDAMIESERLFEFIGTLYEQDDEDKLWELYLSTIYMNKANSFEDFVKACKKPINEKMTKVEAEAILNDSGDILSNFNPNE